VTVGMHTNDWRERSWPFR